MRDTKMTDGLVMRWVPVLDERGRTHMEATWVSQTSTPAPAQKPHAA